VGARWHWSKGLSGPVRPEPAGALCGADGLVEPSRLAQRTVVPAEPAEFPADEGFVRERVDLPDQDQGRFEVRADRGSDRGSRRVSRRVLGRGPMRVGDARSADSVQDRECLAGWLSNVFARRNARHMSSANRHGPPRARLAAAGVVALGAAGMELTRRLRTDFSLQQWFSEALGGVVLTMLVVTMVVALASFATDNERRAFSVASFCGGAASASVLIVADQLDWLSGTAFEPPLWIQLGVYGLGMVGWCALGLALYRIVAARRKLLGVFVYVVFVALFTIVGVLVVRAFVDDGTYVMANGYTVAWDAGWGVAMFAVTLAVYELLRRVGDT
jgi:hypothetical protein